MFYTSFTSWTGWDSKLIKWAGRGFHWHPCMPMPELTINMLIHHISLNSITAVCEHLMLILTYRVVDLDLS